MALTRNGESLIQTQLRTRLEQIRREAMGLAGNAVRISQAIEEVFENGGVVTVDSQMNFITGAWARILKDIGAVQHLQANGAKVRPRPRIS